MGIDGIGWRELEEAPSPSPGGLGINGIGGVGHCDARLLPSLVDDASSRLGGPQLPKFLDLRRSSTGVLVPLPPPEEDGIDRTAAMILGRSDGDGGVIEMGDRMILQPGRAGGISCAKREGSKLSTAGIRPGSDGSATGARGRLPAVGGVGVVGVKLSAGWLSEKRLKLGIISSGAMRRSSGGRDIRSEFGRISSGSLKGKGIATSGSWLTVRGLKTYAIRRLVGGDVRDVDCANDAWSSECLRQ